MFHVLQPTAEISIPKSVAVKLVSTPPFQGIQLFWVSGRAVNTGGGFVT